MASLGREVLSVPKGGRWAEQVAREGWAEQVAREGCGGAGTQREAGECSPGPVVALGVGGDGRKPGEWGSKGTRKGSRRPGCQGPLLCWRLLAVRFRGVTR